MKVDYSTRKLEMLQIPKSIEGKKRGIKIYDDFVIAKNKVFGNDTYQVYKVDGKWFMTLYGEVKVNYDK